jgi:NTE family protein
MSNRRSPLLEHGVETGSAAGDRAPRRRRKTDGIALCLSGGGYRAMLFHTGALWRLNEAGWLPRLDRISSVSGGSITAAVLGLAWDTLAFDDRGVAQRFASDVVSRVRRMASVTIDVPSVIEGVFSPGSVAGKVIAGYRKALFGDATLQDLPDKPLFVINATNVQSGALWRFTKRYMRDYRVGEVKRPGVPLATAVAASAAFPPFLAPVTLELDPAAYTRPGNSEDLHRRPFTTSVVLCDGGVYDNLGLETAWKACGTILVSDAGGRMDAQARPKGDWALQMRRVLELVDNQVRSLRKRQLIAAYRSGTRKGAYWGIRSDVAHYRLADALPCPHDETMRLALVETRLKATKPLLQERLINWGYAVCDAALRKHVDRGLPPPAGFPYPDAGV